MNLDDELRRLFADERLDVPVAPDATEAVVAGARRARRRRAVAVAGVSALTVAALVAGGVALGVSRPRTVQVAVPTETLTVSQVPSTVTVTAPPSSMPSGPPSSGSLSTASPSSRPSSSVPKTAGSQLMAVGKVLGPAGLGPFKLGMTEEQAMATGLLSVAAQQPGAPNCTLYQLTQNKDVQMYMSRSFGLAIIYPSQDMRTAEGIGIGSTFEQAKAAYPDMPDDPQTIVMVAVPANPAARYAISVDANKAYAVRHVQIQLPRQDCGS